jgi:1-pyrroline-5-carboxylate dehydrogenase
MNAIVTVPAPRNEPIKDYEPGSAARDGLLAQVVDQREHPVDLTVTVGGEQRTGDGAVIRVVEPHARHAVLGTIGSATAADATDAVNAALAAAPDWAAMSFEARAAIFLRAADLLSGPWRNRLNAATMLGQSKTLIQAEIDSACELIDFWRYNVHFAREILATQPASSPGVWNQSDYRPLDGFVYAITPFNFTAIAGNLPTAPALMGNVVIWKPSPTQQLAAHFTMRLLEAAGLPPGVINMLPGDGLAVSEVVLTHPHLAGIHFTGSTTTFQHLWRTVGENITGYRSYPRIVGETGGKGFVVAHPSADPATTTTALIRGAFEYQGQKCSAASRAYLPRSLWSRIGDGLIEQVDGIAMGDVSDPHNFMGAVIDDRAFTRLSSVIDRARADDTVTIAAGGQVDDTIGWFVRPTILVGTDPTAEFFRTEYFGPVLSVHVYDDADFSGVLKRVDEASPYALTGSILADDRRAVDEALTALRGTAGNFYINDKPTGAVVGQQPFGGSRASGTNDKAGSAQNLLRWTSSRTIKETFAPATDYRYPHMN